MSEVAQAGADDQATDGANDNANKDVAATPSTKNDKPAGYDPIDVENLPPEVKQRIDYLYSQVKDNKRTMSEYRRITSDQSKLLNDLQSGVGMMVNHLQDKTFSETEATLTAQRNAAYEAGDNKAYHEAQDKLDDLRLEKKLAAKNKPAKSQSEPAKQSTAPADYDDPETESYVDSWQSEKTESGELLRPWSYANHQRYREALIETEAVMKNPRWESKSMQEKLSEVDRRMGLAKSTSKQNVIGGGFTGSRKTTNVSLTPRQEQIAIRTKLGGSKASDAEHIAAMRKQVEKLKTQKGAR